ncbi:Ribosomal protein L22p/L17e [uncultured archaeon]|nr:Ribosomal protein L22p/L17e [uncultured archaeon]
MTEKDYNAKQRENKVMEKQKNVEKIDGAEMKKEEKKEAKAEENKNGKKERKIIPKVKRDESVVNGISLPISTKDSVAICKFIKRKSIDKAISDLEEVEKLKKAIPMTGEIPHRKGKGMMSGRYMTKPVGFFIQMLKSLKANANMNNMEEPIITEAVPNRASRPYGRFGRIKRKRTHIHIKAVEKNKIKKKHKEKK